MQPVCLCRLGVLSLCKEIEHFERNGRRTFNRMKFKISEKLVKERDGANYSLANYVKDTDYVARRAFKGVRFMFRADIFDFNTSLSVKNSAKSDLNNLNADHVVLSVVDPSLVEHKQDMTPIIIRPAAIDYAVRQAKVVKKHQNQRFVETDTLGRVFVGSKGNQIKINQFIPVQNGSLFMGDIGQGIGNVPNH